MRRMLKNWLKKDCGVVAVEFAMIALPFFTLLLGTVEVSLFYASAVVLEGASESAARLVRTGQAVDSGDPETAFKNRLCDMVKALIPCADIKYEAMKMGTGTFTEAQGKTPQYNASGQLVPSGFDAGDASDVVMIRASYYYNFALPFIGTLVTGGQGNAVPMTSTVVIKNEPYKF